MDKPLILMTNGEIYFYKYFLDKQNYTNMSIILKQYAIQKEYGRKIDIYSINDDSIISICINNQIEELYDFLNKHSYNKIPDKLINNINKIRDNLKAVSLELGTSMLLMKVLQGDLLFLKSNKKLNKSIEYDKGRDTYKFNKSDSFKVIANLTKENVNIKFTECRSNEFINIKLRGEVKLRYYQEEAYNQLVCKKKGMLIMPIASGKNYVAIKLMATIKKKTLILCESIQNCERWKADLSTLLYVDEKKVTIVKDNSFIAEEITICSYDLIRKNNNVFEYLNNIKWGMVIYDNAHKAVTKKTIDVLFLKTENRYALASTLNRSDEEANSLIKIFRASTYTITSKELLENLYQKEFNGYKIDLRGKGLSKSTFIKTIIDDNKLETILIVAYKVKEVEEISRDLNIQFINKNVNEEDRKLFISRFQSKKDNILCISDLIENYRIDETNLIIAAGYRGASLIEEDFRIGTLIGTKERLKKQLVVKYYYLVTDDKENNTVEKKINLIKNNYGFIVKDIDIN